MVAGMRASKKPTPPKSKTQQWRAWKNLNLTDARVAIDDEELAWLENAMLVGKGAIQILPGPGDSIATVAAGPVTIWGFTLGTTPVLITVNSDGSMSQITTGGVVTAVCAAGIVTTSASLAIWRNSPILIGDPTKGYFSWDGTTFTVIDATKVCTSLAVFEGRVWLANGREITYTAPNSFSDFTVGNGSGSTTITDEAFPGAIEDLHSALEQLWISGEGAIEALSNVTVDTGPPVVTSFSVTNIVSNVGVAHDAMTTGYFRSLVVPSSFGIYALSGVTPQKISDKLDGLFPSLTLSGGPPAVAVIQNLMCLLLLVTYNGSNAQAQAAAGNTNPIPMLLGFTQGKWFLAVQGTSLRSITTVLVNGVAQAWGTDGSHVYRLFGASASTAVAWKVQSRLYDFGLATRWKQVLKIGVEFQASISISPTMTVDSETSSRNVAVTSGNLLDLINATDDVLTIIGASGQTLQLVGQGIVQSRADAPFGGHYLGLTLSGNDPPFRIQAMQMEYIPNVSEWS